MSLPTLPSEIITEILSYLPVKPLFRFKSVSKAFKTLITSPNFIKLHLSKTLLTSTQTPNFIISSFSLATAPFDDSILLFTELHHPLLESPDCIAVKFFGSCNGVVCYGPLDKAYACLYNPSTGSHRMVPPVPSRLPIPDRRAMILFNRLMDEKYVYVYGFGYDANGDDYKILRMLDYYKNSVFVGRENCVYSLRTNSWKFVTDDTGDACCGLIGEGCAYLDNNLYFIVNKNLECKISMKCFNLQTEVFSKVELPTYDENCDLVLVDVRQVSGRLCIMVNMQNRVSNVSGRHRSGVELVRVEMWVMKESWVRLFCLSDKGSIGTALTAKPLVLGKDGKTVLVELEGMWFGWYDWEEGCFERVIAHGSMPQDNASFDCWTYVESLVSVGKDSECSKGKSVTKKKKKNDVDGFLSSGFKLRI